MGELEVWLHHPKLWEQQRRVRASIQAERDLMFARNMDDEDVREIYIEDLVEEFEKRAIDE